MSYVVVQGAKDVALLASGWRIPAADVARLTDATALTTDLARRAEAVEARARLAEERGRDAGYKAGLEEGRRAGAADAQQALADLIKDTRAAQATLRAELGRLSLEVTRRVASDLGPQAMLEAVTERAVREVLADQPLIVRVAPGAAPGVAQRLWPLNAEVEVAPDPTVGEGDCVIVSRQGSAHAGLMVQLAALERAFREAA